MRPNDLLVHITGCKKMFILMEIVRLQLRCQHAGDKEETLLSLDTDDKHLKLFSSCVQMPSNEYVRKLV